MILPVYNGEQHLVEAVESVLTQDFGDFELLAVDDGSSDSSWSILSRFAERDARVRPIRLPENCGHDVACNTGIEAASGRYIAKQDQDDVWLPMRLHRSVQELESHPELGLVSTSYYRLHPTGSRVRRDPPQSHSHLRAELLFGNVICHAAVTLRASLRATGELHYEAVPGPQDYDLWVRLLKHTRAATIPEPLVIYRMHSATMSALFAEEQPVAAREISERQLRALIPGLDPDEIEGARQAHGLLFDGPVARRSVSSLFGIWEALARQPDIDPDHVAELRRRWSRRALTSLFDKENRGARRDAGFLLRLIGGNPSATMQWLWADAPAKLRARGRARIGASA